MRNVGGLCGCQQLRILRLPPAPICRRARQVEIAVCVMLPSLPHHSRWSAHAAAHPSPTKPAFAASNPLAPPLLSSL